MSVRAPARLDLLLSASDLAHSDPFVLLRACSCSELLMFISSLTRFGLSAPVFDLLLLGPSPPLKSLADLGSPLFVFSKVQAGPSSFVLDLVPLAFSLSLRSSAHLEPAFPVTDHQHLGSSTSPQSRGFVDPHRFIIWPGSI